MTTWMQFGLLALFTGGLLWCRWQQQRPAKNHALTGLLETAIEPIAITNQSGQVIWRNKAAQHLWTLNDAIQVQFSPEPQHNAAKEILTLLPVCPHWQGDIWLAGQAYQLDVTRMAGYSRHYWLWQTKPAPPHKSLPPPSDTELWLVPELQWQQFAQSLLTQSLNKGYSFCLFFLQLDDLPALSLHLGEQNTQRLMQQLLQNIQPELPVGSFICQVQPNKYALAFAVLAKAEQAIIQCQTLALELASFCQGPFQLESLQLRMDCSIGIALAPDAGSDLAAIKRFAGLALIQAQQQPRRVYCWQTEIVHSNRDPQVLLDLEQALQLYQCQLWFQPVLSLESAQHTAYQIELRWASPQHGLLNYDDLTNIASESGHLILLERWAFSQLCQQVSLWQGQLTPTIQFSFSHENLLHTGFMRFIEEQLADFQLTGRQFILNCQEDAALQNETVFLQTARQLTQLGFRLQLAEVGVGVGSCRVMQLPCWHGASLSAQMIQQLEHSDTQRNYCADLIRLLLHRELQVQICGIETELQAYLLHVMGAHNGRGDCFAAMQPLSQFTAEQWQQAAS